VGASDLREVLDKVSAQIQAERKNLEHAASLRARMSGNGKFLKEKLLASLFSDESEVKDAAGVLEQLRGLGCPVPAPWYVVVDAAFTPTESGQEAAAVLAENSGGIVSVSDSRSGTRLFVLGDTAEDAEERGYAFATSLVRELERSECTKIRVGIGEIVSQPEQIYQSFRTARHIRHLLADRTEEQPMIFGVREMGDVPEDGKTPSVISEAKVYLAQHFTNPSLMLQDVAKEVGMSNSRFSTVFSQQTGQTFTEYLISLRLKKAKELLRTTGMKNAQVAQDAGYSDSHYFSYIFKKNTGMTPSEYRALHSGDAQN
jgi:two-component system response regulator YesN